MIVVKDLKEAIGPQVTTDVYLASREMVLLDARDAVIAFLRAPLRVGYSKTACGCGSWYFCAGHSYKQEAITRNWQA